MIYPLGPRARRCRMTWVIRASRPGTGEPGRIACPGARARARPPVRSDSAAECSSRMYPDPGQIVVKKRNFAPASLVTGPPRAVTVMRETQIACDARVTTFAGSSPSRLCAQAPRASLAQQPTAPSAPPSMATQSAPTRYRSQLPPTTKRSPDYATASRYRF